MKIKKTQKINIELNNHEIPLFLSILESANNEIVGQSTNGMTEKQLTYVKEKKDFIKTLQDIQI